MSDTEISFALQHVGMDPWNHARVSLDRLQSLYTSSVLLLEEAKREHLANSVNLQRLIVERLAAVISEAQCEERVKTSIALGVRVRGDDLNKLLAPAREQELGLTSPSKTIEDAKDLFMKAVQSNCKISATDVQNLVKADERGVPVTKEQIQAAAVQLVGDERTRQLLGIERPPLDEAAFASLIAGANEIYNKGAKVRVNLGEIKIIEVKPAHPVPSP